MSDFVEHTPFSSLSYLQVRQVAKILLLFLLSAAADAATLTVAELMQMLGSVESANARFVETRVSALLKSPLVLRGTLEYRRPDRIVKHVLSPYDERVTVEGGRLTLDNRASNRKKTVAVSSAPGLSALIESIRATRAGDLAALQRHYALQVEGSREQWTLTLKPLDAQVAAYVSLIALTGSEARIGRITVEEVGGDRSVMEIEEGGERAPSGKPSGSSRSPPHPPINEGGERAPSGKPSGPSRSPPHPPVSR